MYVHEIEYETNRPDNRQERYLEIESWYMYVRCVTGQVIGMPIILPDSFEVIKVGQDELIGKFTLSHKNNTRYFIHIGRIVERRDIPDDALFMKVVTKDKEESDN